jgi:hypothetical protein
VEFEVAHEFEADVDEVAATLLDHDFQASLKDIGALAGREVISQEEEDGVIVRRVRCLLDIDVNGMVRKFIGDADPAWVEVGRWNPEEATWKWHIEPEAAADMLQADGQTVLIPSDRGTIRKVTGTVKVKVPLYGGRVESWIIDGLERAYDEEAVYLEEWLGS